MLAMVTIFDAFGAAASDVIRGGCNTANMHTFHSAGIKSMQAYEEQHVLCLMTANQAKRVQNLALELP